MKLTTLCCVHVGIYHNEFHFYVYLWCIVFFKQQIYRKSSRIVQRDHGNKKEEKGELLGV